MHITHIRDKCNTPYNQKIDKEEQKPSTKEENRRKICDQKWFQ